MSFPRWRFAAVCRYVERASQRALSSTSVPATYGQPRWGQTQHLASLARALLHEPVALALPVSIAGGFALVVLLLASCQRKVELDESILVVQVEWYQGVTALLNPADKFVDFLGAKQKLARAGWIRPDVRRCSRKRADMHPDDVQLAIANNDVALLDLHPSGANSLNLPAFENQTGLEAVFDEVVVKRFAIIDNAHLRQAGKIVSFYPL